MPLLLEQVECEGDVVRRHPAAVVEFRLRPHREPVGQAVARNYPRTRREPVHRVGLVAGRLHQRREGVLHAERGIAPEDVAVERVEGEEVLIVLPGRADLREQTTFRRVRIGVFELLEVGRVLQVAEAGHAVAFAILRQRSGWDDECRRRAGAKRQRVATRETGAVRHWRDPVFAARCASHHQMVGNAAAPYSGIFSGWPKRSQRAVRTLL